MLNNILRMSNPPMTTVKTRIKNALDLMYVQPTELVLTPKFILDYFLNYLIIRDIT